MAVSCHRVGDTKCRLTALWYCGIQINSLPNPPKTKSDIIYAVLYNYQTTGINSQHFLDFLQHRTLQFPDFIRRTSHKYSKELTSSGILFIFSFAF